MERIEADHIHFVGIVSNVRDYFAMGDAGVLPSYFKGESYPLVIMECLMTGKPVIATSIGEVPNQVVDEDGNSAALLVELEDGKLSEKKLAEMMVILANDNELYRQLRKNTNSVSRKFSIKDISDKYLSIYQEKIK